MADVNLTITIPDAYVARVVAAFEQIGGSELTLQANDNAGFYSSYSIDIPAKGSETTLQYGKKFIKHLILGAVKVSEQYDDKIRYQDEIAVISPVNVDVPDEVIS